MAYYKKKKNEPNLGDLIFIFTFLIGIIIFGLKGIINIVKSFVEGVGKLFNYIFNKREKLKIKKDFQNKNSDVTISLNLYSYYLLYNNLKYLDSKLEISLSNYPKEIIKKDLINLITYVYKDIQNINSDSDFDNLFSKDYYSKLIIGMNDITEIKSADSDTINALAKQKILNDGNCNYDFLEEVILPSKGKYFVEYQYILELLSSCKSIGYIFFINNVCNRISENSEIFTMIKNMSMDIDDKYIISEKTYELYKEFYQNEYGELSSNSYSDLVNNLVDKIKFDNSKYVVKENNSDIYEYLIEESNKYDKESENMALYKYLIPCIYVQKINDIALNIDLLLKIYELDSKYNENSELMRKQSKKDRYLSGDFNKEKKEIEEKYNINNISTGEQFELYLANIFKALGYKVKHTGKAGDQGADLILKYSDKTYVVQAKFYSSKLDNTPVQEIVGAIKYYNANQGVVITNSTFTQGAEKLAKANNVILIDGIKLNELIDLIYENQNSDILKKF